jgi:hypothetical protein
MMNATLWLAGLIEAFRDSYEDQAQLESALHTGLRCEFTPSAVGMCCSDWLHHVAARLRAAGGTYR